MWGKLQCLALIVPFVLLALMVAVVVPSASGQEPGTPAEGAKIWPTLPCMRCHGSQAEGGFGPKIAGTGLSFEAVLLRVRNGKGAMPAFSADQISDDQVGHIYAWLRSLAEPSVTPAPATYPVESLLSFQSAVNEVKVRFDFAKDLPQRLAPDDATEQLNLLKQYVEEGMTLSEQALRYGEAALQEVPDQIVQEGVREAMDVVRRIVEEGDAALAEGTFEAAWPHAAEMVRLARLDAWPLATQAVRDAGWTGTVTVEVTDQTGEPIEGAFVTVLTDHAPIATVVDADGKATIDGVAAVPTMQVKAYAEGLVYHEVHVNVQPGGVVEATIVLPSPNTEGEAPRVEDPSVEPAQGPGDGSVTFSVTATDPQGKANLAEDQIFALSPELGRAYVLRDAGGDRWQSTVALPDLPSGTHTFYIFAVDHQCNTSNVASVSYEVP